MRTMTKQRRRVIERLKKRARAAALTIRRGTEDLDCGMFLAGVIRPHVAIAEQTYDNAMLRLRRIDPQCPGYRGHRHQRLED